MGAGGPPRSPLSAWPPVFPQICSLLRGGIAERGGVRVGHRIIEINGHSVVATPHARVIELLTEAHPEVRGSGRGGAGHPSPEPGRPQPGPPPTCRLLPPQVHIKTMPAATYRLLTGQEQPVYL